MRERRKTEDRQALRGRKGQENPLGSVWLGLPMPRVITAPSGLGHPMIVTLLWG